MTLVMASAQNFHLFGSLTVPTNHHIGVVAGNWRVWWNIIHGFLDVVWEVLRKQSFYSQNSVQ